MIVFDQALAGGRADQLRIMNSQYAAVNQWRDDPRHNISSVLPARGLTPVEKMAVNAGRSPADLYREFDTDVVEQFKLDEGDNILNRLMPLARSIPIGRTILENARASDSGNFSQSMSGEVGSIYDNVDYDINSTIIPVNQTGFKRNWREGNQLSLEQFDDAVHQQREAVRRHRNGMIDSFLDGHKDANGADIVHNGVQWQGVRRDERVTQATLTVDFTSTTATASEQRDAFKNEVRDVLWLQNLVSVPVTYFVSNEILSNWETFYSNTEEEYGTLMDSIKKLSYVAEIVGTSRLTGNQILGIPMQRQYIQPVVGMAVSTIARSRPQWNSPFEFDVVSAVGWDVRPDFESQNSPVIYASS